MAVSAARVCWLADSGPSARKYAMRLSVSRSPVSSAVRAKGAPRGMVRALAAVRYRYAVADLHTGVVACIAQCCCRCPACCKHGDFVQHSHV